MQEFPKFIWSLKYQLKDSHETPIEFSMDESKDRAAKALAVNEKDKKHWEIKFRDVLECAIPAGRIMSNAGAEQHKTAVSLINCLTGDTPVLTEDGIFSIDDLMGTSTFVLNGKQNWTSVEFQQYGEQEVVELTFKLNHEIKVKATLGHRWILTDGSTVTSQYLIDHPNTTVPCVLPVPELNPDYDEGVIAGLLFDHDLFQVARNLPEKVLVQNMTENYHLDVNWSKLLLYCYQAKLNQVQGDAQTEFRLTFRPAFPSYYRSASYLLGFFAGLFAVKGRSDFSLPCDDLTPFQINYLKNDLIQAGILVKDVDSDQIVLDPRSLTLPFFLNTQHRQAWLQFKAEEGSEPLCWTYLSHQPLGIQPVYCCQELETKSFVLSHGILTGNCVVSDTIEDSMESISAKLMEAASTLKFGCGTGYSFSTLRPEGSFVRGSGSTTSGPLSFMDVYDLMCKTITSAGGRRGAQMATFLDSHPDIFKFIEAKRQDGRLRNFNLSVLTTNAFIQAVREKGPWTLHWKDEIRREIQAEQLWNAIMESAYNWAEPGFLLVDRINQFNNLWFEEYLAATNPSMPAGTLVLTDRGILPIESLERQDADDFFQVKNLDNQWSKAKCFFSGHNKPLIEITFDGKRKIKSTPEHKWPVFNPSTMEVNRVLTSDLKVGDLIPLNPPKPLGLTGHPELTNEDGFLLGFLLNYGLNKNLIVEILYDTEASHKARTILDSYRQKVHEVTQNPNQNPQVLRPEILNYIKNKFSLSSVANSGSGSGSKSKSKAGSSELDLNLSEIPSLVFTSNDQFITGVLDGIISTGFSIVRKGITYKSKDRKKFKQVAKLLGFLGIKCSLKMKPKRLWRSKYTLTIKSKYALSVLLSQIQITNRELVAHIEHLINTSSSAELEFNRIVKIKPAAPADVWDISVYDDQHVFPISWGFTGNCGEQALPPYGACLLGSLMLHRFVRNPFSPNAYFDMTKYRETVITFTRMLDNVVELANLPLPEQMRSIKWTRRHGMGYMGLGSALIMMGIRYGSPEALAFVDSVTRELAMTGMEAGIELAKEKGCAPVLDVNYSDFDKINLQAKRCFNSNWKGKGRKSKVRGIDLFLQSHYFDNFREESRGKLILRDIEKYGCRFSHHSSLAPTGCCHGATRIQTNDGIKSYWEILESNDIDWQAIEKTNVKQWFPIKPFNVLSIDGKIDTSDKIWYNGYEDTVTIKFEDGSTFVCTRNHKLLVLNEATGEHLWVEADFLSTESVCAYRDAACHLKIVEVTDNPNIIPTWDIEAQSTHCYLLENGVVSHNTIASSFGENCCLAKGTIVDTDHGFLPIEDVTTDMKVMNFDVATNRFDYAPITFAGLTRPMTEVYELELEDGKKIRATADHKFLVLINEELRYESLIDIVLNGYELYEVVVAD